MSAKTTSGGRRKGARAGQRNPVSRTTELARKRERRSFRFRLLAFTSILLVLLLAAAYQFWLRDSSLVAVKNLEVVGVSTEDEEGRQIDQAVRTAMGEMTTLHIQPELLERELSRYPRVAGTSIDASFPDSATVTVDLRDDGSIYGDGPDALLIATDGTVLGPAAGQEASLPLIETGDDAGVQPGETLTGRALRQARVLGAAPPALRPFVSASDSTAEGVEVTLENGPVLLFGDPSDLDQKWRAAAALIADQGFEIDSYVDLTVPRRPAVSAGSGDDDAGEALPEGPVGTAATG